MKANQIIKFFSPENNDRRRDVVRAVVPVFWKKKKEAFYCQCKITEGRGGGIFLTTYLSQRDNKHHEKNFLWKPSRSNKEKKVSNEKFQVFFSSPFMKLLNVFFFLILSDFRENENELKGSERQSWRERENVHSNVRFFKIERAFISLFILIYCLRLKLKTVFNRRQILCIKEGFRKYFRAPFPQINFVALQSI